MKPVNLENERFPREFWIYTIISLLINGYFVMFSTITLMFGNDMGLSPETAGFLASSFSFAMLLMRPFSGMICDRFQKRKVLLLSMLGYTIGPLVFLFPVPYGWLIFARIWEGLSMGVALTAASTLAIDTLPKSVIAEGVSYFGISTAASGAIFPGVGLFILNHFGYPATFLFGGMIGALISILTFLQKPAVTGITERKPFQLSNLPDMLFEKKALFGAGVTFVLAIAQVTVMNFLSYEVIERGYHDTGLFYPVSTIVIIAIRLSNRFLYQEFGIQKLLKIGLLFLSGSYFLIYLIRPAPLALIFLAVIYALGHSTCGMILHSLCVMDVPSSRLGVANSTYYLSSDLSYSIAPILWNVYSAAMGYRNIYLISGILVFSVWIFVCIAKRNGK